MCTNLIVMLFLGICLTFTHTINLMFGDQCHRAKVTGLASMSGYASLLLFVLCAESMHGHQAQCDCGLTQPCSAIGYHMLCVLSSMTLSL